MRKELLSLGLVGILGATALYGTGCSSLRKNQFSQQPVAQENSESPCGNVTREISKLREKLQRENPGKKVDLSVYEKSLNEYCNFCNSEQPGYWTVDFKGNKDDLNSVVDSEYKKRYGENYRKFGLSLMSSFASEALIYGKKLQPDSATYAGKIDIPNNATIIKYAPVERAPMIIIENNVVKAITAEELEKYVTIESAEVKE